MIVLVDDEGSKSDDDVVVGSGSSNTIQQHIMAVRRLKVMMRWGRILQSDRHRRGLLERCCPGLSIDKDENDVKMEEVVGNTT
ncbi:hypothetical protein EVAR_73997_1 [Eumeta japonica]|uniref:Uncharacterized protein n=1 Tax=Eumeta variegata TaxID=151549 RepID=A0A4C1TIB9_EUMVA|nr:hypothetical protein EVAR_73997_1 [Eumeta japonica]